MADMNHKFTAGVRSKVTVGATSTKVMDARSGRKYATIVNDSNETMYLNLGGAAVSGEGIRLNASGGSLEIGGDSPFSGEIYAICASGGKSVALFDAT